MPLEIRELNIKVNLSEGASGAANASKPPPQNGGKPGDDQEQALKECLDEVMHLLRNRKER